MLRRLLQALPAIVTAPIFFLAGKAVSEGSESSHLILVAGVAAAASLVVYLVINVVSELFVGISAFPPHLETLRIALNSATRDHTALVRTTVGGYARHEDRLVKGDRVYILTHDLYIYDCIPAALEVIARNVVEGVRYDYFLAEKASGVMKEDFCARLEEKLIEILYQEKHLGTRAEAALQEARRLVRFRRVRGPLLYPFSITYQQGQWADAHWYAARPDGDQHPGVELSILYFRNKEQIENLTNLFDDLNSMLKSAPLRGLMGSRR